MKFEKVKSEGLRHEYDVVISAEDIENRIVEIVKDKAKTYKMQGFRPGHVPLNIVRSSVEAKATKEALDALISNASRAVVKESKVVRLATNPMYKLKGQYEKGKDLGLTLYFDESPSFELKSYDLKIEKIVPNVTQQDVDEAIKRTMDASPVYEKTAPDYVVKPKDMVSYQATCYNNGVESKKKSFSNAVIIPDVIPEGAEFLGKFIGKKVGESFDFVPATDKNLKYKIELKSIEQAMTDITPEDYAKRKGLSGKKVLEDTIKEQMENEINDLAYIYHKSQILEQFSKDYKFDIPQEVFDREMGIAIATYKREEGSDAPISKPTQKAEKKKSDEEIRKELKDVVNKRCILGYVLNRISEKEKITITEADINAALNAEIYKNPMHAQNIIDYYKRNPGALDFKKAEVLERKVIEFLLTKTTGKEVKKTKAEMEKILDELLKEDDE
ncbi:MAG: trigger factor [Alphaproteobacteria bacterium]|nr:trigger factor [Alphaproteobacteria bacterium]